MIFDKTLTLYNGVKIPVLGLGTWMISDDKAASAVKDALQVGYRHIDTAEAYENERGVGEGIHESKVKREDIFLTTKLVAEAKDYASAKQAIDASFAKLGVDYLDLLLIHSPEPWDSFRNGNHYEKGNLEVWRAMVDFYKQGKIKAIGVSNFEKEDIENIIRGSDVKPMVNQILTHISNTQFDLIRYCQENDIVVEAYSPIAHGEMLKNTVVQEIAHKYNVSVSQLCIKYTLELGLVSLPKTANRAHMAENASLDFHIAKEDMDRLLKLEPISSYGEYDSFPVFSKRIKG